FPPCTRRRIGHAGSGGKPMRQPDTSFLSPRILRPLAAAVLLIGVAGILWAGWAWLQLETDPPEGGAAWFFPLVALLGSCSSLVTVGAAAALLFLPSPGSRNP